MNVTKVKLKVFRKLTFWFLRDQFESNFDHETADALIRSQGSYFRKVSHIGLD